LGATPCVCSWVFASQRCDDHSRPKPKRSPLPANML